MVIQKPTTIAWTIMHPSRVEGVFGVINNIGYSTATKSTSTTNIGAVRNHTNVSDNLCILLCNS